MSETTASSPDHPARALALGLFANAILNLALAVAMPAPWNETVLTQLARVARPGSDEDSWSPMAAGLAHLESGDPRPLYRTLLIEGGVKFQYPPGALLLLELARSSARVVGASPQALLDGLTKAALVITALASAALLRGARPPSSGVAAALAGLLTLSFYPALKAVSLGQIQASITAALALLLLAWRLGHRASPGLLLGLVCVLKPHFALLALWAAQRREWRFLGAAGAAAALPLAISVGRYGLAPHLDYLGALAFLGRRGESFYPNQSMVGLLHRSLGNGNNVEWIANAFPPYHPAVFAVGAATSLALVAAALVFRAPSRADTMDLAAMLLAVTLASPIAWEHHYAILAPIFCLLLPGALRPAAPRWELWTLGASYLFSANLLAVAQRLAETAWNPLQSYLYFAALLALGLLLARRPGDARPDR